MAAGSSRPGRSSSGRDGIEEPIGALSFESDAAPPQDVAERVAALSDLVAVVVDRARLATNAAERIDWAERVANSRHADRPRERPDAVARHGARDRPRRAPGLRADHRAVRRRRSDRLQRRPTARPPATTSCARLRRSSARRFASWIPSPAGAATSSCIVAPGAKGTTVAQRIVDAVAARSMAGERRATVSAGLARFPVDGSTGDDLVRAATSALRAAQAAGPGTLAEATHDGSNGDRFERRHRGRRAPDGATRSRASASVGAAASALLLGLA